MIQLQIISKILASQDFRIVEDNLLTEEHFVGYADEFNFIKEHLEKYGNVPDTATFLSTFPDIELVEVTESDKYLIDTLQEEYLFQRAVPVVQTMAKLLKTDSNAAAEYLIKELPNLQPNYDIGGTDIIAQAKERFQQFQDRKEHQDNWFFTSGFEELDDIIHGIQRTEELVVLFARTNQGKSWVLEKMISHIWQLGFNVGYVSPEMSASSIGYRFDTLTSNYSNKGLIWGKEEIKEDDYERYIDSLEQNEHKFIVATPLDFAKKITISKLRKFVKKYKLDALAVDGITYLQDERFKRGDSKTTSLTNISEDLMALSIELNIPILVVVQANRNGVGLEETGTPELEHIRDSDGIAHNASKAISIRQTKAGTLEMGIKKQRFGVVGGKLNYQWDIDTGKFTFIPSYDDAEDNNKTEEKVRKVKKQYNDASDVF